MELPSRLSTVIKVFQQKPCVVSVRDGENVNENEIPRVSETDNYQERNGTSIKTRVRKRTFECSTCGKLFQTRGYLVSHMRCHSGEKPFGCMVCGKAYRDKNNLKIHERNHTGELPYLCNHCGKGFAAAGSLKKHEWTHTGEKPHACDICSKRFISPAELGCHMRTHTKEKPYICSKCTQSFSQISALKKHEAIHSGERTHKCVECNLGFFGVNKLQEHLIKHHGKDGRFKCKLCGMSFMYAYQIKRHEVKHADTTRPYGCTICGRCYQTEAKLRAHEVVHGLIPDDTEGGVKQYTCSLCDRAYRTAHGYSKHMARSHIDEVDRYICSVCQKEFKEAVALKKHEMTHTGERPLKCDICNKGFIFALSLKRHKMRHTGELPFKCGTCGDGFFYKARLTTHMMAHNGTRPYACVSCGKGFMTRKQHEDHKLTHGNVKPFLCSTCGMRFKVPRYLQEHLRLHAKDNPYKCRFCDKVCTKATDLKIHEREHTGDKPFKCSTCIKSFACAQRLTRHKKTHSGEKPYSCSECTKRYTEVGSLRVHVRRAHSKEDNTYYICTVCDHKCKSRTQLKSHMDAHDSSSGPGLLTSSPNVQIVNEDQADTGQSSMSQVPKSTPNGFNHTSSPLKTTSSQSAMQTTGYLDLLISALTQREPLYLNTSNSSASDFGHSEAQSGACQVLRLTEPAQQNMDSLLQCDSPRGNAESDLSLCPSNQNNLMPAGMAKLEQNANFTGSYSTTSPEQLDCLPQPIDQHRCRNKAALTDIEQNIPPEQSAVRKPAGYTLNGKALQLVNPEVDTSSPQPTYQQIGSACIVGPVIGPSNTGIQVQTSQFCIDSQKNKTIPVSAVSEVHQSYNNTISYTGNSNEGRFNPTGYIQTYMGSLCNQSYGGLSQLRDFTGVNPPVTATAESEIAQSPPTVNSSTLTYVNLTSAKSYAQAAQFDSALTSLSSTSYAIVPESISSSYTTVGTALTSMSFSEMLTVKAPAFFLPNPTENTATSFGITTDMDSGKSKAGSAESNIVASEMIANCSVGGIVATQPLVLTLEGQVHCARSVSYCTNSSQPCDIHRNVNNSTDHAIQAEYQTANSPNTAREPSPYPPSPVTDVEEYANQGPQEPPVCEEPPYNDLPSRSQIDVHKAERTKSIVATEGDPSANKKGCGSESDRPEVLAAALTLQDNSIINDIPADQVENEVKNHVLLGHEPCSCSICDAEFNSIVNLRRHMKKHTGKTPYRCALCETGFGSIYAMEKHMMIHRNLRPFSCQMCDKSFRRSSDLEKHLRIHTNERPFKCTTCDKGFRQQSGLVAHIRVHTGEAPYQCKLCGKNFKQSTQLKRHGVVHTGEKKFACGTCGEAFCYSDALRRHKNVHMSKQPAWKCDVCEKSCASRLRLRCHMSSHGPVVDKQLVVCITSKRTLRHQENHDPQKKLHGQSSENKCLNCLRPFRSKSALKRHVNTKHKVTSNPKESDGAVHSWNKQTDVGAERCRTSSENEDRSNSYHNIISEENNSAVETKETNLIKKGSVIMPCKMENNSRKSQVKDRIQYNDVTRVNPGIEVTPDRVEPSLAALSCTVCGTRFTEASALKRHVRTHTATHPFKCTTCARCFTEAASLKTHIGIHRKDKHLCFACGKVYMSVFSLRAHMKLHADQVCVCVICGLGFTSPLALKNHTRKGHQPAGHKNQMSMEPHLERSICKEVVTDGTRLQSHMKNHAEKNEKSSEAGIPCVEQDSRTGAPISDMHTDVCPICHEGFTCGPVLEKHLIQAHVKTLASTGKFLCFICGLDLDPAANLRLHMNKHSRERTVGELGVALGGLERELKCSVCDKLFVTVELLKGHLREHLTERNHLCDTCGKGFLTAGQLKIHIRTHTGERPYKCGKCSQAFHYPGYLAVHMRTHTGERPYVCAQCGKGFIQLALLNHHRRLHQHARSFPCKHCAKRFKSNRKLTIHYRVHSNHRPYVCGVCGKGFKRREHCRSHEKIHTGRREHRCAYCAKEFFDQTSLRRHQRVHTGERPHECENCGKSFAEAGTLTKHRRTHIETKPHARGSCGQEFVERGSLIVHMQTHTGERQHACMICGKGFASSGALNKHVRTHKTKESQCGEARGDGLKDPAGLWMLTVDQTPPSAIPQQTPPPTREHSTAIVMYQLHSNEKL